VVTRDYQHGISDLIAVPVAVPGSPLMTNAIYMADTSHIFRIQDGEFPTSEVIYRKKNSINATVAPVYDSANAQLLFLEGAGEINGRPVNGTTVTAFDPFKGIVNWQQTAANGEVFTPPVIAGGSVYLMTTSGYLYVIDSARGTMILESSPLPEGSGQVQLAVAVGVTPGGTRVMALTNQNWLYGLDGVSGTPVWWVQPMNNPAQPTFNAAPVVSESLVYAAGSDGNIYGFAVASKGTPKVAAKYVTADSIVGFAGFSNGNVYFGLETNGILGVNLESIENCFQVECDLIQDFGVTYSNGSGPGTGTVSQFPAYHCHVTLYRSDSKGNLSTLPNQIVQIESSDPLQITANSNQVYSIDSDKPASLTSDGNGKLVIAIQAGTVGSATSPACLSCPSLTLWGNFMEQEERILIYPDQPLHSKLAGIKGHTLQHATTFPDNSSPTTPGPAMAGSALQGKKGERNAAHLAQAINNTMGAQQLHIEQQGQGKYLAPSRIISPGVRFSPKAKPAGPRQATPGETAPNYIYRLDADKEGNSDFQASTFEEVTKYIERKLKNNPEDNIFTDIADFVENVVNDVENVVEMALAVAEDAITAFIQTTENLYHLVVQSVEDAANLVLGVLKSVVADVESAIESVIQALSFLFDFSDFIATHTAIVGFANQIFGQSGDFTKKVRAWKKDSSAITGFLNGLGPKLGGAVGPGNPVSKHLGSQSLGQAQGPNSDPSSAYTKGGGSSCGCTSMSQKANDNAPGASISSSSSALDGIDFFSFVSKAGSAFETFLGSVGQSLGSDFADMITQFMNVLSSPSNMQSNGAGSFVQILTQDIASDMVNFLVSIVDAFIAFLDSILSDFYSALTTPLSIPVVSDLYQWIVGSPLTLLDLFAFLLAIPTTIIYKALTGKAPSFGSGDTAADGSPWVFSQIMFSVCMLIYTIPDVGGDLTEGDMGLVWGTFGIIMTGLTLLAFYLTFDPALVGVGDEGIHNQVFFMLSFLPIGISIYGLYGIVEPKSKGNILEAAKFSTFYGVGYLLASVVYAIAWPDTWLYGDEPSGMPWSLLSNICASFSPMCKVLTLGADKAVFDIFGDVGCAVTNIGNWQTTNGLT